MVHVVDGAHSSHGAVVVVVVVGCFALNRLKLLEFYWSSTNPAK